MSKYERLTQYLRSSEAQMHRMSFSEIEDILGSSLPKSAYTYPAWWSNQAGEGHTQTMSWQSVGWRTSELRLGDRKVTFVREKIPTIHRERKQEPGILHDGHQALSDSLTIAQAKAGLSAYFKVPEENIEITIRG